MYYVYVLRSGKDKSFYTGYTTNLQLRIKKHKDGEVISTRHKRPWNLLFFEGFIDRLDAKNRERYLKSGWGRRSLAKILNNTIDSAHD